MHKSAPPQGRSTPHHHGKKELSVLMLLLAAETVADCCVSSDDALSTELIASSRSDVKMLHNRVLSAASHHAEPFEGVSSAGDSDTATPVPESVDEYSSTSDMCDFAGMSIKGVMLSSPTSVSHVAFLDGAALENILAFLSWRDNLSLRRVSRLWFEATLSRSVVCRMPSTGCPAIFLPCRRDLDGWELVEEARLSTCPELDVTPGSSWLCASCGWFNEQRAMCGNRGCHALGPAAADSGVARIFLGQLRREGTVPLIRWLFDEVLGEPSALIMVENHRHKITSRGKGCAWVYLRRDPSQESDVCDKLLAYHRRLFVDVVNGVEGVWIVHPSNTDALSAEVSTRGYAVDRPRHLPRNALVTELPLAQQTAPQPADDATGAAAPAKEPSTNADVLQDAPSAAAEVVSNHHAVMYHHDEYYYAPYPYAAYYAPYYHQQPYYRRQRSHHPPSYSTAVVSNMAPAAYPVGTIRRHNPYAPLGSLQQ